MIAFLFANLAFAGDADVSLARFEVGEAIDGQVDTDASSRIRTRTDLIAQLDLGGGWGLTAAGALRLDPLDPGDAHAPPAASDLYRLAFDGSGPHWTLSFGRVLRTSPFGTSRVDGAVLDVGGDLGVTAWGGRVSHPEPVDASSVLGAGIDVRWRPSSRVATLSGLVGYEIRGASNPGFVSHRLHAAGTAVGPRGGTLDAQATLGARSGDDSKIGVRAVVRGEAPVGATRVVAGLRWEGFPRDDAPETALGVEQAIAPDGYGVVDLGAAWRRDTLVIRATGGPSIQIGDGDRAPALGGSGRVMADLARGKAHGGAFAATASIGPSWYAGAGVAGGYRTSRAALNADAGLFRFHALTGPGVVGEARAWGDLNVGPPGHTLHLQLFGAAGTDRLRKAYLRGGVGVRGVLG